MARPREKYYPATAALDKERESLEFLNVIALKSFRGGKRVGEAVYFPGARELFSPTFCLVKLAISSHLESGTVSLLLARALFFV